MDEPVHPEQEDARRSVSDMTEEVSMPVNDNHDQNQSVHDVCKRGHKNMHQISSNKCPSEDEKQNNYSDFDNNTGPSFTDLPEVALVGIMDYLSLEQRYSLSLTCWHCYHLFSHPYLWRKAYISLLTHGEHLYQNRAAWKFQTYMLPTMSVIVQRFAHLFQHLTLELQGFAQPFDKDTTGLLQLLGSRCRLESLVIKLGPLTSTDAVASRVFRTLSNFSDLPLVVGLLSNAFRLKQLSILSWPLQEQTNDEKDIFSAMLNNKKLQCLESLNLFFPDLSKGQWTERIAKLPSPELTLQLMQAFPSLINLSLRSPMLCDDFFYILAKQKRTPLASLQILVQAPSDEESSFNIAGKAWQILHQSNPWLKVEVVVFSRVQDGVLRPLLQPDAKLASVVIHEFGRCDAELITFLSEGHKKTLNQFICFCESLASCDEALLSLVSKCELTTLIYHGEINHKTVKKIASILTKRQVPVKRFEVREKNVKVVDLREGEESDDIVVARDRESNELYLPGLRAWHQDEEEVKKKLDNMSLHVSDCLGYHWWPV